VKAGLFVYLTDCVDNIWHGGRKNMADILTLVQNNLLGSALVTVGVLGIIVLLVMRGHPVELGPVKIGARSISESKVLSATMRAKTAPSPMGKWLRPQSRSSTFEETESLKLLPVSNGDLGHSIKIGGIHEGFALRVVACDWVEHVSGDQVRSGWLYSDNNAGAYLPVAFFKVHLSPDSTGYAHLCDAASPPHTIWLKAHTGHYKQMFHYMPIEAVPDAVPAIVWPLRWKEESQK